jgi:hypothetical protein
MTYQKIISAVLAILSCVGCIRINYSEKYEGVVLTKYGYPVKNNPIFIFQAVDETSTREVGSGVTDNNGNFSIVARVNHKNTCFINVEKNDSGFVDHVKVSNKGAKDLKIILWYK